MKKKPNYILIILFIGIIGYFSINTKKNILDKKINEYEILTIDKIIRDDEPILQKDKSIKQNIASFEKQFNDNFYKKQEFVENYGLMNKLLHSNFVDDADSDRRVIRGDSGALYYSIPKEIKFEEEAKEFKEFQNYLKDKNIGFSVVIPPNKINKSNKDFPQNIEDYTIKNTENFETQLNKNNIEVLNLDKKFTEENNTESSVESFYLTDSHWKIENIFWAYKNIYKLLENKNIKLENKNTLLEQNYEKEKIENIYIGSMGKRVGQKYIDKKDDIRYYFQKNNMEFEYNKFNENGQNLLSRKGNFKETFFFKEALENENPYSEKYISMMFWGQYLEKITNKSVNNNTKILVIRDSFALPMCSYLAQNVKEVIMVENRLIEDSSKLYEVINKEKPDYVIFMGTTTSAYYYPNMFKIAKK